MVFSGGPGKRPRDVQTKLGITGIFRILYVDDFDLNVLFCRIYVYINIPTL